MTLAAELVKTSSLTAMLGWRKVSGFLAPRTRAGSLDLSSVPARGAKRRPPFSSILGLFSRMSFLAFCVGRGLLLRVPC